MTGALPIPIEALEDCGAILGRRGAGKSGTRTLLLEHELDRGRRCCLIDPKGDSWGIRLDPDGSPSRFQNVPIFGGVHGDLQLADHMGEVLGELVATHDLSCVLDLSSFSVAGMRRFMRDFAAALFDKNRAALTLFVDEADQLAPQRLPTEMTMLLHHMESLIRQGRQRGIFMWMLTQRPQILNKNLLSQAETLVAMKMTTPHDRGAIRDWMEAHDPEQAKQVEATLAQLAVGEAWAWVPAADFLERVQFPLFSTFDSMRTPRHGEKVADVQLAPIDISAIAKALADPLDRIPDDPAEAYRAGGEVGSMLVDRDRRIAELEEENASLCDSVGAHQQALAVYREWLGAAVDTLQDMIDGARIALDFKLDGPASTEAADNEELTGVCNSLPGSRPSGRKPDSPAGAAATTAPAARPKRKPPASDEIHPMAVKLVEKMEAIAPARLTWRQLGSLLGYKPDGGYFRAGKRDALQRGLLVEEGDYVRAAAEQGQALDRHAAFELWREALPDPAPRMMDILVTSRGPVAKEELARELGYAPTGGHFRKGLALLRQNGVSIESGDTVAIAKPLPGEARS